MPKIEEDVDLDENFWKFQGRSWLKKSREKTSRKLISGG